MAGQHMGVVVLHHAAHTCKQNLTFQVELRILQEERKQAQQGLTSPLSQAYIPLTSSPASQRGRSVVMMALMVRLAPSCPCPSLSDHTHQACVLEVSCQYPLISLRV